MAEAGLFAEKLAIDDKESARSTIGRIDQLIDWEI
jgi:hypothetical protein